MNQGSYFGAYRQGFQTMPDNAYEMMTAPSRQISGAIKDASSQINSALVERYTQQRGTEAVKQGNIAQYKGLESLSKATGVPVNPELTNQFANMGEMKTREKQAAFQASLAQEAQRIQNLYGINQAQARAAQAAQGQGMQQFGSQIDYMIAGRNQRAAPAIAPAPIPTPRVSPSGFYSTF
jgi:hypothetical protein